MENASMTIDIDQAERLANAATPGPWTVAPNGGGIYGPCPIVVAVTVGDDPEPVVFATNDDLDFIAAARTLVPALIAEVRRLTKERDAYDVKAQRLGEMLGDTMREVEELRRQVQR